MRLLSGRVGIVLGGGAAILVLTILAACSSSDATPEPSEAGAGTDGATSETGTTSDGGGDSATSDGANDGGTDAPVDANEAGLPPLCQTYPDTAQRYAKIAYDAVEAAGLDCALGTVDMTFSCDPSPAAPNNFFCALPNTEPQSDLCLALELRALAGCQRPAGGGPYTYDVGAQLDTGVVCVKANPNEDQVRVGFFTPATMPGGIRDADVERLIKYVRDKAVTTGGMAAADADRLAALLRTKKSSAVTTAGAGFSRRDVSCDAGM